MRYLFFDIECCNGRDICEFGYVITDEKFNIIEKDDFIINPEKKFNLTNRKGHKDLELFYSEEEYKNSPVFPFYYDKIRELLEYKDQIIMGHSVGNDVQFLVNACKRYNLGYYDFDFFDSQKVYNIYANEKGHISLEKAGEIFNIEKPKFIHKSDEDAEQTMEVMKSICESLEMTLSELKSICLDACGKSGEGRFYYRQLSYPKMLELLSISPDNFSRKQKKGCLEYFMKNVKPCGKLKHTQLTGKKLCFNGKFEKENINETCKLIQLMADCGCEYNTKVSENDYYVVSEDELREDDIKIHSRLNAAVGEHGDSRNIKVISFPELYEMLGITKEGLNNLPFPVLKEVAQERCKNSLHKDYIETKDGGASIFELIKANKK